MRLPRRRVSKMAKQRCEVESCASGRFCSALFIQNVGESTLRRMESELKARHRDDEAMEVDFGFDKIDVEVQDRIDDMVLRQQVLFDLESCRVATRR